MNESALHAHRLLLRAGLSIANVFAWIFVFEYFYVLSGETARALAATVLLYALAQLVTIVATPVSAAHLQRGIKHSLIWGVVFLGSAFVVLGATLGGYFSANLPTEALAQAGGGSVLGGNTFAWEIAGFAVLFGAYRALYWVPYTLSVAEIKPHLHMRAYFEVLIALMPLFAGLTIASVAFAEGRLLFGAAILIAFSALPVLFLHDTRERFSWPYVYTFRQLWKRKNHGPVLQSLLEGLQGAALFLVWPLAVFLIVEWSYLALGFVFSMTLLFILLLRRVYSWMLGSFRLRDSTTVHVVIAVSGWVARLAAGTPIGIIIADAYSYTTQPERGTRVDPFSFEHASDRGSFIDEYTVLKEIALGIGKIMLCVIIFLLAFIFSLPVVFAIALGIAAAAAGVSVLVARRVSLAAY